MAALLTCLSAWSVNAADTTITIGGKVISATCTVGTTLAAGQLVELGTLGSNNLQKAGDADPAWHNFSLELTNCPTGITSSTVTFSGTPDNYDSTLFANTEPQSSAAENVAVEMSKQSDNSTILSNNSQMTVNINTLAGTASFPLAARMKTPTGGVHAGHVSSTVLVDFIYQ